jgi:hypothetical protein
MARQLRKIEEMGVDLGSAIRGEIKAVAGTLGSLAPAAS